LIKATLKLLIALAVVNAAARGALVAWRYYQLRDQAQQLVLFGANQPTTDIADQILSEAVELDIPLDSEGIVVGREGNRTFAEAAYTQPLEYFPTLTYPLNLSFSVEAFSIKAP
jgi:hypothetical protein